MPREVGLSLLPGTYTLHFRAEGIAGGLDSLLDNVSLELLSDVALVRIVDYYPLPLDAQWIYQGFDWDGAPAKSIRRVDATNTSIMLYTGRSPVTSYTTNVVSEYNAYLNPTTMMPYDEWISYMAGGSHFGYFGDAGAGDIRLDGGGVLPEFMTVGSSLTNMVDAYIAGTFVGSVSLVVQLLERASLTVPAGSFTDVLRVRIAIGTPGGTEVHDEWWARGVGSIKEEGISGDGVLERWELIEYAVPLPPVITAQPASRTNAVGSAATFCVSTTSSAPLSYQWRFNNTDLTNGGRLSGVTSPCLVISGLRTNDAGDYTVVVTNVFGSVTSAVANLTVVPAAQFDPDLYLTNAIVLPDGRAQLEVVVPSNGVYSLLMSTNLVDWESVENLEGPTNRFIIVGPDPPTRLSDFNTLFLRAAVGLVPQYQLHFDFNDTAGTLVPGTPSVSFPQSIRSYFAFLEVNRIANPAADTEVFFTGPPGSGFTNAPPFGSRVDADHYGKNYWTATLTTPPEPPPGDWTVDYAGAALKFEGIDPQARFVIPQPTVIVSNGLLTSVSWVYRNATTGEPLAEAPMFVTAVNVQLFGGTPPQSLYDSNGLGREDTQFTFSPAFLWADVSALEITYEDESGNAYVITYAK
jgi:hypothetical protein